MKNIQSTYTLIEIASWDEEQKVSLPTVQRGFVWKPYQIENLWDSLLRGYPIGAFVLSDAGNNTFHILDGQQRATAICLGFAKETFRDSQDYYKVFIDLELPKVEDTRKFIFRVITRSHPWGYRKQESQKTLTTENIRKAMDYYTDIGDPLIASMDNFYPFDAILPIPFYFFLEEASKAQLPNVEYLISRIDSEYKHWKSIKQKWIESNNDSNKEKNAQEIDNLLKEKIQHIFNEVIAMLNPTTGQKVPALYMNLDEMLKNNSQDVEDEVDNDEVENLFLRLNSGGTQLSGEELNYSILKAHLSREVQYEIELVCKQLFKPARFITIAFRLFQHEDDRQSDALTMRIKPKQFQRTLKKDKKKFEEFVLKIIRNKQYDGKTLLVYAQSVLEYNNTTQRFGLPFLLYSKISDTAPEIMYLLLYRIYIKDDRFSLDEEKQHRKLLGIITLFIWYGKGENLKDHSKLLSNIWPAASTLDKDRFWSSETVDRAFLNDVLLPFPLYKGSKNEVGLDTMLEFSNVNEKTNIINRFETKVGRNKLRNNKYTLFIEKAIYNNDYIIYAQRHFLENYFSQQQYRLEDTSMPFDWDHIYPNNLVRNKKNIPQIVKDWYQTNGNFRAWPYALNRMDSDNNPCYKLNPLENIEIDSESETLIFKWQSFIHQNKHLISDIKHVSKKVLEWSFCKPEWKDCNVINIKQGWKEVTKPIIKRNILLIKEWYEELGIEDLRKENTTAIEDILDNRKWKKLPINNSLVDNDFDNEESVNLISSEILIGNASLNFFITYPIGSNGHLEFGRVEFGLYEGEGHNYIKKIASNSDFLKDEANSKWVFGRFTIVSNQINSYLTFLKEVYKWIDGLQVNIADKQILHSNLLELLSSKIKKQK